MKKKVSTMEDLGSALFEIRAICDVAVEYADGAGESFFNTPGDVFDRLSVMLQLIQERVAELEDIVNNAIDNDILAAMSGKGGEKNGK